MRGVPLIHLPTTLLAQADSSLGGKTAVNHGQLKNKIGAFYQPRLVISDITTLKTLTPRLLSDGLAEIIKHAAIRDAKLFAFLEDNLDRIKALDDEALETIVFQSVRIKAEVVEKDELDLGLRNILNYGHTIGHAVESLSDFEIDHGQTVAIGMLAAARISNRMGLLESTEVDRLKAVIEWAGLLTGIPPNLKAEDIIQSMKHDKKIAGGRIRFVLLRSIGEVFITDEVSPSLVKQALVSRK
jgi:3-dehydroquinate synthase